MDYALILRKCISESDTEAAVSTVKHPEALSNPSQIIAVVCEYLNEGTCVSNPKVFQACGEVFNVIASECDAEDVLLELVEAIPRCCDNTAFESLLQPLHTTLTRLPTKRLTSFKWGLNAARVYLESSPKGYPPALKFYASLSAAVTDVFKVVVLRFLVQLCEPFATLELQDVATQIATIALQIKPDIHTYSKLHLSNDIEKFTTLSLAFLYYLVLVEGVAASNVPKVYDPVYVFRVSLGYVVELCQHDAKEKALKLLEYTLEALYDSLPYYLLDDNIHSVFCKTILNNVIVYNSDKAQRMKATELFHKYLFAFKDRGRFLLVYNLTKTLTHTQSLAYVIQQYKEMLVQSYKQAFTHTSVCKYYSGANLWRLLVLFIRLPKGEETNLLESSSVVISTLNLLRFLFVYDTGNVTQIWNYIEPLERRFLGPLQERLVVCKRCCNEQLSEVAGKGVVSGAKLNVIVDELSLPDLDVAQQENVYRNALNTVELMETVLGWLNEAINL